MAAGRYVAIGLTIAVLTLALALAATDYGGSAGAPPASPTAAHPAAGLVDRLEDLLSGEYEAQIAAYPVLNGQEAPPAHLAVSVRRNPLSLEARGEAASADDGAALQIVASVADGRLSYTTSALDGWLSEEFRDLRQVYGLFGLIDDLALLEEVLAAGAQPLPAPETDRRAIVLPEEGLVQQLLADREEVLAEGAQAVFTMTALPGGGLEVLSRLVYQVGGERYEVNRVTRLMPARGLVS